MDTNDKVDDSPRPSTFISVPRRESPSIWRPILAAEDGRCANAILKSISDGLMESQCDEPGLARGASGAALTLAYLSRSAQGAEQMSRAVSLLDQAVTCVRSRELPATFFSGPMGIIWTLEHVNTRFGVSCDACGLGSWVDEMIMKRLGARPWHGVYDSNHGLVGYGLYAAGSAHEGTAREAILDEVVNTLARTAIQSNEGLTWWTPPQNLRYADRRKYPCGYINVGVAHGIASVIALLGLACRLRIADEKARYLFRRAVSWLLSIRQQASSVGSWFPNVVGVGTENVPVRSRIAWCFGDLGVSATMYTAACNAGDQEAATIALQIARQAASRGISTSGVKDAAICHGAAGVAHIFNRLYQATSDETFLGAARRWYQHVISYSRGTDGTPVKPNMDSVVGRQNGWPTTCGLFDGLTGVALSLHAAVASAEPEWDRLLFMS
jgi:lantibiotic biosynthesis protein